MPEELVDDFLAKLRTRQVIFIAVSYIIMAGIYSIVGILRGPDYLFQWMIQNAWAVTFFAAVPIGLAPVYGKADDRISAGMKQLGYSGVVIGSASFIVWLYGHWVTNPTPFQSVVIDLSGILTSVTAFSIVTSVVLNGKAK